MSLRTQFRKIFSFFQKHKEGTVREAAVASGTSKSSAHRHKQALERRNQHPESWLWETEEGFRWLIILVCATIYMFGIRGGMGMGTIAEFFILLRVDTHLGVSPSSLFRLTSKIEQLILAYKETYEQKKDGLAHAIVGADETFFEQVILVMMELSSGYILLEEPAADRTFLTWKEKAQQALQDLGMRVRYMVSDQATALTKLALEGLGCQRIPDLFHAMHDLVKLMGSRFSTRLNRGHTKLSKALVTAALLRETGKSPETLQQHEQMIATLQAEQQQLLDGQRRYYEVLHALSAAVHPFSLIKPRPQTSSEVMDCLFDLLETLDTLREEYGIADSKNRIKKVRRQVEEIAAVIDLWWIWVRESLREYAPDSELVCWLLNGLLPVVYWDMHVQRTSTAALKKAYEEAHAEAVERLQRHRLTATLSDDELSRWNSWAEWIVTKFQRTSSAVEGRNGVLSRMNHAQRSIPLQRLKVLTVIHNFGITRNDGTTAAERLFGEKFPDLFEWIVTNIHDLPLPRKRLTSPSYQACPALGG
jgi:hypothetical protein